MADAAPWRPIDSYPQDLWRPHEAWVRAAGHEPVRASWGYEDETWDGEEEFVYGAWHEGTSIHELGFEPEEWCELSEYSPPEERHADD